MNWLAHIFLSEPHVENRLGNLLGDLVKGREVDRLNDNLRRGIDRHRAIDRFTDSHEIVRMSKARIDREYARFAGAIVDVFYDHLLAKNWRLYSDLTLTDFTAEIYDSFQNYRGDLPLDARQTIDRAIAGDWFTNYRHLMGIRDTLERIDLRLELRLGRRFNLGAATDILEREYLSFDRDFQVFFPQLQSHIDLWANRASA